MKNLNSLVGNRILKTKKSWDKELVLLLFNGEEVVITITDEGDSGNDSRAYFSKVSLLSILGERIIAVEEHSMTQNGGIFIIKTKNNNGMIEIKHDHNGYYGWGFFVSVKKLNFKDQ